MADPRDPRKASTRPINESLDEVASGLSVFLSGQQAVMAELLQTQKDIQRQLVSQQRPGLDRANTGEGVPGLAPPPPASQAVAAAQRIIEDAVDDFDGPSRPQQTPSYHWKPTEAKPLQRLNDIKIDPASGRYADQTRKGIRDNIYANLAARAENANARVEDMSAAGTFSDLDGNRRILREGVQQQMGTGEWDPETGSFDVGSGSYVDANGNFLSAEDATEVIMRNGGETSLLRKAAVLGAARNVAGSAASGAPIGRALMSAVPSGLLKGAGVAGIGIQAGRKAWDFAQGQYAANREMQGIYGDGNMDQVGRRLSDWWEGDVMGNLTMLGSGTYKQLIGSGRQLGLDGGDLNDYVDTGAGVARMGVSDRQTTQLLDMVIQAGDSLSGLEKSIRGVNDAAKDAGINAARAREVFMKNYETSGELMFGGGSDLGRQRFATSLTEAQLNQQRQYQGSNTAVSVLQNQGLQSVVGFQNGLSQSEMASATRNSPGSAALLGEEYAKSYLNNLQPDNGSGMTLDGAFEAYLAQKPGGTYDPQYDQADFGDFLVDNGFSPQRLHAMLQGLQIPSTVETAAGIVGQMFSNQSTGRQVAESEQEYNSRLAEGFTDQDIGAYDNRVRDRGQGAAGRDDPLMSYYFQAQSEMVETTSTDGRGNTIVGSDRRLLGENRLGAVEELLGNADGMGLDHNTIVRVLTEDGPRAVTLPEALRYYPDQLQSGQAVIVDGADDDVVGQSVGDLLDIGTEVRQAATSASDYSANQAAVDDVGRPFQEWEEENEEDKKSDGGGGNTTVTLDLTPEARRLLQPSDSFYESEAGQIVLNGGGN